MVTPVTFLDAHLLEHIGKAADGAMQLLVGHRRVIGRVIAFPDQRDLIPAGRQMPVNAIVSETLSSPSAEPAHMTGQTCPS